MPLGTAWPELSAIPQQSWQPGKGAVKTAVEGKCTQPFENFLACTIYNYPTVVQGTTSLDHRQVDRAMRVDGIQVGQPEEHRIPLAGAGHGRCDGRLRGKPPADGQLGVSHCFCIKSALAENAVIRRVLLIVYLNRRLHPCLNGSRSQLLPTAADLP